MIPLSLGNGSVSLLLEAWGSPMLDKLPEAAKPGNNAQALRALIETCAKFGCSYLEDYVGWGAVEPSKGSWDWSEYQANAEAVTAAGLKYIPFVWLQNAPRWARDSGEMVWSRCLEHDLECEFPSIFSDRTMEIGDRVYGQMASAIGDKIDALRIACPYDYGEIAYPAGVAAWAFPQKHAHPGWWCGEDDAREHFRRATGLDGFTTDHSVFRQWYAEALTERMGVLIDVVRGHFPQTPLIVSIGWPVEKPCLGHDISGIAQMASEKGVQIRCGSGPVVSFLSFLRTASALRHFQVPAFSSEPTDGTASPADIALALFKDMTGGVTWHFDYEDNYARASDHFAFAAGHVARPRPDVACAVLYPDREHRASGPERETGEMGEGGPGYPAGFIAFCEAIRARVDYDVLDERLIEAGALSSYRVVMWPSGEFGETARAAIDDWVQAGGVLIARHDDSSLEWPDAPWQQHFALVRDGYDPSRWPAVDGWAKALAAAGVDISDGPDPVSRFNYGRLAFDVQHQAVRWEDD